MVRLLLRGGRSRALPGLLRERGLRDAKAAPLDAAGRAGGREDRDAELRHRRSRATSRVRARGGSPSRSSPPTPRRGRQVPPEERDDPPGAAAWARRARAQEQALLRRWIALEAA